MKFFNRTRIFSNILCCLSIPLFLIIIIQLLEFDILIHVKNRLLIFIFLVLSFIILLGLGIALKCVAKDAQEDLNALLKLKEKSQ